MKAIYFDCFSGISGDMVLGSLVDLGADFDELKELSFGAEMSCEKVNKRGIVATKIRVLPEKEPYRTLKEVLKIVDEGPLDQEARKISSEIFRSIAEVESKIHGKDLDEIHFHEVGAIDAIVEITGVVWALKKLNVGSVYSSPIPLGGGKKQIAGHHGYPIPSPATLELLSRRNVPVYPKGVPHELTTPTGAAIITNLAKDFILPPMTLNKVGYGAADWEGEYPNVLRAILGVKRDETLDEEIRVIEADIDDMNPELYEHLTQVLLEKGAKDVTLVPIHMKKNRPGIGLRVLSPFDRYQDLLEEIFLQTTTLGVRVSEAKQIRLKRELITVKTPWGEVKVKMGRLEDRLVNIAPEYDSCRKIAVKRDIPLKKVYEAAMGEALRLG